MHVAPPERRLDSMHCRHARVVAQKLPYLGIHASLYRVVGGFPCASELLLQLHECEHGSFPDKAVQDVSCLAQALMGVLSFALP